MLKESKAFSGFSVNDLASAEGFYSNVLGLETVRDQMGLQLKIAGGNPIFVYQKPDHVPASYTILNFPVDNIDQAIDELTARGVTFEHYDNMPAEQDEREVLRGEADAGKGPDIAWFKDPAGNILSVLSN